MKKIFIVLICLFLPICCLAGDDVKINASFSTALVTFEEPLNASFTVDQLFDRMEKKSEVINAIESEVELSNFVSTASVVLRIKSPDKFSIIFADGSSSVYFNGSKLWIYIKSINECFYHFSEDSSWFDKFGVFTYWFEPKKIFLNMTRSTLNTIFELQAIKREKTSNGDYHYSLRLTPKFKDIFKEVFEVGYYECVFSDKIYLPVKVIEFSENGKLKNILVVKSYKMNGEVPDDYFEFKNTFGAPLIPISIVILQKFEDYKDKLLKKIEDTKDSLIKSLSNWGF